MDERLVLEIDGPQITADDFVQGVQAFLHLIKDVAKSISGSHRGIRWVVGVQPGSVRVEFPTYSVRSRTA